MRESERATPLSICGASGGGVLTPLVFYGPGEVPL